MHKRDKEGINREIEEFLILRERERENEQVFITHKCVYICERKSGKKDRRESV